MQSAPETPHAKYPHVYAIVRVDSNMNLENCATGVKVLASREQAEEEVARLKEVNKGKHCTYTLQITRFIGAN